MDDQQEPRDLSTIAIGPIRAGDEVEILKTFNKVFNTDRSEEVWRWEYADNPEGMHVFLARFPDGKVVSQFAGIPRRVKLRDETRCFSEIVDSMTDPEFRKGLKKPGWFASTCNAFVDHYGRPDRESIMYGFPIPPAFRVGRALLGYSLLYKVELLSRSIEGLGEEPKGDFVNLDRLGEDADHLYERFAVEHEVMTVRDARYLNWRFLSRPDFDYEVFGQRESDGSLLGLCVLRHDWTDRPISMLCELMVPEDSGRKEAFLKEAESRARAAGAKELKAFFRPESKTWALLNERGYEPEGTQWRFVARSYDQEKIPLEWLKDAWYLSLGDFDLV